MAINLRCDMTELSDLHTAHDLAMLVALEYWFVMPQAAWLPIFGQTWYDAEDRQPLSHPSTPVTTCFPVSQYMAAVMHCCVRGLERRCTRKVNLPSQHV